MAGHDSNVAKMHFLVVNDTIFESERIHFKQLVFINKIDFVHSFFSKISNNTQSGCI